MDRKRDMIELYIDELGAVSGGRGECRPWTTEALGEEAVIFPPVATTLAVGEEGCGPIFTTLALGEEGCPRLLA
jgi:hypothetical protein